MEDEVVISGTAGRFPGCRDVDELTAMLFNKENGVTSDNRRWDKGELGVPHHLGKISDPYTLDLTFFGINPKLGERMDPQAKLIMQVGFSAICDAGISPSDLAGSNTATLIGSTLAETEYECLITKKRSDMTILSHAVPMQANRIAYCLDLKGPSYVCDSTWNGALHALRYAKDQISRGSITAALVVCTNLIFMPQVSYHYHRLGRLNEDGKTKCFSDDADGYSRSEGCVAFFLQRKEDALRNYGTIAGVNTTLYASKNSPLSDCSDIPITYHLQKLYKKSNIDPSQISYLEASGCASKVVDAMELNASAEIFLQNRKEPLLIGSIKSNLGHAEAASGFFGILKAIIAAESGMIPPNLYYSSPNNLVPSLISGKLKVVTEATPLEGDYLAVNSISAVGEFGHVIIKKNPKTKKRKTEVGVLPPDGIPRLVLLSGREENGLAQTVKTVEEKPIDEEFIALTHQVFSKGIKKHTYRGYTILDEELTQKQHLIKPFTGEKRPLWYVFTGMGSQWAGMGGTLMKLPTFEKAIQLCHDELKHLGIDVINIVTSTDTAVFDNILNAFVGISAMQIALVDIMNEIGVVPDGIVGHSFGELGCAYYDGTVSAKQAILAAYNRGKVSIEAAIDPGLMAAVGLSNEELLMIGIPKSIDISCHNSKDSCTISGPVEDVENFVAELQKKRIFARSVATCGIAFHSRYIQSLGPKFKDELKKIIPTPAERSSKWVSSSVAEEEWGSELAKYSSADYHTNNLINPVLFEEACRHIPKNAIIVEIAPHGLLQQILKRTFPFASHIPLTNKADPDSLKSLLSAIGKMYIEGIPVNVSKLYPPVEFPVSRATPSLGNLLDWSTAGSFKPWTFLQRRKNAKISKEIIYDESNHAGFQKCTINGIPFIPAAAYLSTIMDEFLKCRSSDLSILILQNIKIKNLVKHNCDTTVFMSFQRGSGNWEFSKEKEAIVSGKIDTYIHEFKTQPITSYDENMDNFISSNQIYSHFEELGLTVHCDHQLIKTLRIHENDVNAEIAWSGDWLAFLDATFKIVEYLESIEKNELRLISIIERIIIDLSLFNQPNNKVCTLNYNKHMGLIWGQGIEILYPSTGRPNSLLPKSSMIKKYIEYLKPKYTSYQELPNCTDEIFFETCLMIATDDLYNRTNEICPKLLVIEILENIIIPNVVNEILRKQNDIETKIASFASDFLMLNLDTRESTNSYTFIISGSKLFDNTLKVLNHSLGGYLIYKGDIPPPSLEVIISKKIGDKKLFFCKTVKKPMEKSVFVLFDNSWKSNLIRLLNQEKERLIFLIAQLTSLPVIHDIIEQSMALKNSHLLRFAFIDTELALFQAEKYEDYFRKDLRLNIFTKKEWGTSLLYPINLSLPIKIENNVFNFSHIKCPDVELHYLGLDRSYLSGINKKPELYEYSGVSRGEAVCGLATLNTGNLYLQPDPDYLWAKPENMSHDEIASILLVYTMAYYIFDVECCFMDVNRILVHNGLLPFSQAVINIAIRRGIKIFITYDGNSKNKEYLKNKYPQIHEDNILNFNTSQFDVPILLATEGKGVDVIVNTLADTNKLMNSLKCLKKCEQRFFQMIIPSEQPGFYVGLRKFLPGCGLHCFYPEQLFSLPTQTKKILRDLVDKGLKTGEVKLNSYCKISSASLNIDSMNMIKCDDKQKLVVSMKDPSTSTIKTITFICDLSKFYLIIGDQEHVWFDLLDWLIKRGARKFLVCLSTLAAVKTQKLNAILNSHDNLSITTCSIKKHSSLEDIKNCMDRIGNFAKIDTAFVIGEGNQGIISPLATAFNEIRVIAICNGPGVFQEYQTVNSRTLIIKTLKRPDYSHLLNTLDYLMNLPETVVYMNEYTHNELITDSSALQHWQHIPTSYQEIISSAKYTKEAFWKELRTNSPPYKHCRETFPVFVLPSLKKGQMKLLIKSLNHPAFEAVLPSYFKNLNDIALQLLMEMARFSCSVFTLICSDWMWLLGLKLGKLLEQKGKTVSLILLGISPQWVTPETVKMVYSHVAKEMSQNDSEKFEFKKGIQILQERVRLLSNHHSLNDCLFKGLCHLITYKKPSDVSLQKLTQYCQRKINMKVVNEADYLCMLNSNVIPHFINSIILFEPKDYARLMNKDYDTVFNVNLSYLEE